MNKRYSKQILTCLVLIEIATTPMAMSDDIKLWSDDKQFVHPYSFMPPVISHDAVYLSMFDYQSAGGWQGQLQKFHLSTDGRVVDKNGAPVLDCNGTLLAGTQSFWANNNNTHEINTALATKLSRQIFTNSNSENQTKLIALSEEEQKALPLYLADSMHSQPRILVYGHQHQETDRRILLGTNSGILHLFKDMTHSVDESWAFIPTEFLSRWLLPQKPEHQTHPLGLDGAISVYFDDKDRDGVIEADEGDRLWVFFGLRQGGRSYYALDLTAPDHPILKWQIDGSTADGTFKWLGETWSAPQFAHIAAGEHSSDRSLVLVLGAGYDPRKNSYPTQSAHLGNAIYVIDADSGKKLFSVSPDADSLTNLQVPLTESIPAEVALLDSDNDGFTDRLYAGDTGGNIWRLDMVGNLSDWRMSKFAELGHEQNENNVNDRRFFGQPVIVRSMARVMTDTQSAVDVPADWVLVGSGDRANPESDNGVQNRYFVLPDWQITPYKKSQLPASALNTDTLQNRTPSKVSQNVSESLQQGWYVDLARSEKVFGNGYVVAGNVWFSSFSPVDSDQQNAYTVGLTRLYRFNLQSGSFGGESPLVKQYHDRLLENLGSAYQPSTQQLWMTGLPSDLADKNGRCSQLGMSLSDAIKLRQVSEYQSDY